MDKLREYINEKNVIKDEFYTSFESSFTCSICSDIFIEPTMCMNCQNVYCKECIEGWLQKILPVQIDAKIQILIRVNQQLKCYLN